MLFVLLSCDYGMYGNTSCCISNGNLSVGEGDILPTQHRDPSTTFHKIWNIVLTHRNAHIRGLHRCGWYGQIARLMHENFFLFVCFFTGVTGRIFRHTPRAQYVIICRSGKVSVFWGLEWWNTIYSDFVACFTTRGVTDWEAGRCAEAADASVGCRGAGTS